jgi:hypothetical protein
MKGPECCPNAETTRVKKTRTLGRNMRIRQGVYPSFSRSSQSASEIFMNESWLFYALGRG